MCGAGLQGTQKARYSSTEGYLLTNLGEANGKANADMTWKLLSYGVFCK